MAVSTLHALLQVGDALAVLQDASQQRDRQAVLAGLGALVHILHRQAQQLIQQGVVRTIVEVRLVGSIALQPVAMLVLQLSMPARHSGMPALLDLPFQPATCAAPCSQVMRQHQTNLQIQREACYAILSMITPAEDTGDTAHWQACHEQLVAAGGVEVLCTAFSLCVAEAQQGVDIDQGLVLLSLLFGMWFVARGDNEAAKVQLAQAVLPGLLQVMEYWQDYGVACVTTQCLVVLVLLLAVRARRLGCACVPVCGGGGGGGGGGCGCGYGCVWGGVSVPCDLKWHGCWDMLWSGCCVWWCVSSHCMVLLVPRLLVG